MLLTSPQCSERCVKCGHRPLGSLWHWSMFKEKASKWNSGTGGSDEFGLCTLIFHATFLSICVVENFPIQALGSPQPCGVTASIGDQSR